MSYYVACLFARVRAGIRVITDRGAWALVHLGILDYPE